MYVKYFFSLNQFLNLAFSGCQLCRPDSSERCGPFLVISGSLGFDDQLAFSRIFRKNFALSPSEYRKISRQKKQ